MRRTATKNIIQPETQVFIKVTSQDGEEIIYKKTYTGAKAAEVAAVKEGESIHDFVFSSVAHKVFEPETGNWKLILTPRLAAAPAISIVNFENEGWEAVAEIV